MTHDERLQFAEMCSRDSSTLGGTRPSEQENELPPAE